jgi:hypothetical protein
MATTRPNVETPIARLRGDNMHSSPVHLFWSGSNKTAGHFQMIFVRRKHTPFTGGAKLCGKISACDERKFV